MIEALIGLYVLVFLLFVVGFWAFTSLSRTLQDSTDRLNALSPGTDINFDGLVDDMRETVEDIVANTLQSLEPPRAIDHIFGAVAQMIQARTMQMMNPQTLIGQAVETVQDMIDPQENV